MPLIVVYNLSKSDYEEWKIEKTEEAIIEAVTNIPELGLKAEKISFTFPQDPTITTDEIPVIIIVELLFDEPKITHEIRQRLAKEIAKHFTTAVIGWKKLTKITVAVKQFDREKDGYYSEEAEKIPIE